MKLGEKNAQQYLEAQGDKHLLEEARLLSSLKELQRVLDLPALPGRIEAYDISNIQGTNPVGSMIVFDFARPKKSDYRKFKIKRRTVSAEGLPKAGIFLGSKFTTYGICLPTKSSGWYHSKIPEKITLLPTSSPRNEA